MKKRWKLDNKGMTLLEVIVAFAIFAIAAVILMSGFSIALRVMGNSNEIKEASQSNAGKLNVKDSGLEDLESVKNSDLSTVEGPLKIIQEAGSVNEKNFVIPGTFHIATSEKKTNMSLKLFEPNTEALITPPVPIPDPSTDPEPQKYEKWEGPWPKTYIAVESRVEYNGLYYQCVQTHTVYDREESNRNPAVARDLWYRTNGPDGKPLVWDNSTYYAIGTIVLYSDGKKYISIKDVWWWSPTAVDYWKLYEGN